MNKFTMSLTNKFSKVVGRGPVAFPRVHCLSTKNYGTDVRNSENVPAFIKANELNLFGTTTNKLNQIMIDTRDHESFIKEHIKHSGNIHDIFTFLLEKSDEESLSKMQSHFIDLLGKNGVSGDESEHVILYEQGLNKMYGASCRGYFILKYVGHPNVSVLQGGLDAFKIYDNDGLFLETGECVREPTEYKGTVNNSLMSGKDDILSAIKNLSGQIAVNADGQTDEHLEREKKKKTVLLDVRDAPEWHGSTSSPYGVDFCPRKGRIPNSIWIEWYDFMEIDNSYCNKDGNERVIMKPKSKQDVRKMMNDCGVNKDDEIIVYCFKGSRASNSSMILKESGYTDVKNYFASWNEWSRDLSLPIDDTLITPDN